MRFRISGKDFVVFVVFASFLLYLCAILTSNISSFGTTGTFSGLNPIPGLTRYLGATIVLFIILVVIIFTSVSSYIFERKKGIGFELSEKEEKGYSRWAKDSEIKNDKGVVMVNPLDQETSAAGIPLVNDGKHLWVDNGQYHNLVIGSTGSGKSQTVVEPMVELLIKKGESMIITDPKGELYRAAASYMKERGYNVVVLNFREPQQGNAWNPLTLPYQYYKEGNPDKAIELLDDVAANILYDQNNKSADPFWEKSSADYFSGLALGLFEDANPDEINLSSINYMSTVGEDKMGANTYIKEYFLLKGEASAPYVYASNTVNAPADTKGSILSVFRQKIRLFASRDNLSEMLSYSDFDMRSIGKEKTAVFIVIHDEKTTYHSLATIFIKQCYETLIDVAQANGGKLPYRTNFILDEFANMPPLKDVTTMVTAARSRDIRFTFIIQNFAQLKSVYGDNDAETIRGNCGNLVYLISTELAALEEISKMCGEVKSKKDDKTSSTPLVTVTDLQKLKLFQAIIIRWRLSPYKVKYTPNFEMDWGHPKIEATFPSREKKEVKHFDVKEFTKQKKGEKYKNSLTENGGMMDGGMNPFRSNNPFAPKGDSFGGFNTSNPFKPSGAPRGMAEDDGGLFGGGLGGGIDLDAMMRDIDRKIAELDAQEEKEKAEQAKLKNEINKDKEIDLPKFEMPKVEVPKFEAEIKTETPSVKVDVPDVNVNVTTEQKPTGGVNIFSDKIFDDIDDEPIKEAKIELPKTEKVEINNYNNQLPSTKKEDVTVSVEHPNIAIATSSPIEEDDLDWNNNLPKVESTTIIKPTISTGTVVKANENGYNIYNKVPDIVASVKDEIKTANEVKEETKKFTDGIEISKDKLNKLNDNLNDYNVYTKPVQKVVTEVGKPTVSVKVETEKTNVNVDPDKIVIGNNNISDDEFFDDFFGDD